MRLCLDTNAYVKLVSGRAELRMTLEHADTIFLPAVVLGELCAGFAMGSRTTENMQVLADFMAAPGVTVAGVDAEVAERYGMLVATLRNAGTPLPTNDIWIAATAMCLGTKLVTYDRHFQRIPGLLTTCP